MIELQEEEISFPSVVQLSWTIAELYAVKFPAHAALFMKNS
jgi:hypothetical protein